LQLRRTQADLHGSDFSWVTAPPQVLRFRRGGDFTCVVNLSDTGYPLPADAEPLLTSQSLADPNVLEPDTAAWLRLAPPT
jgi:alpha-glucosidase